MDADEARHATLAWLSRREPPPPFELERRVRRAVERLRAPTDTVPHTLAAAALQCLRDAVRDGKQRSAANELLAADALLTFACESAAESGLVELDQFTREFDVDLFEKEAREARES